MRTNAAHRSIASGRRPVSRRRVAAAAALDVLAVIAFVAIGRRSHDAGDALGATLATALPFLSGLAVAWGVARAWRRPAHLVTGLAVWPVTVLTGMLVRRWVFDRGTATSFVIVATLFLGVCFVGWRAVDRLRRRR